MSFTFKKDKRGQGFNLLMGAIVAFIVVAVVIVVGINISQTLQAGYITSSCGLNSTGGTGGTILYSSCGYAYNASVAVLNSYSTFTSYFTILALVIIASVVLYFLLRNLGGLGGGSQ